MIILNYYLIRIKNLHFHVADFEIIIDEAKKRDFIFVDPPYTVKHNLNGFISYNEKFFIGMIKFGSANVYIEQV